MIWTLVRATLVSVAALVLSSAASAAPLAVYGALPNIEDVALAPDGNQVALVVTNGEQRVIVVQDLATRQLTVRAAVGAAKIRFIRWASPDHLIIVTTVTASPFDILTTQREWMMAFRMDVRTRKVTPLLRDVENGMNTIYGPPAVRLHRGEPKVFVHGIRFVNGRGRLALYRVRLNYATSDLAEVGSEDTRRFVVGTDGEPVAQEVYEQASGRWTLRIRSGSGWRDAVTRVAPLDPPSLIGLGPDGNAVLYAERNGEGRIEWKEVRLDAEASGKVVATADLQGALFDPQDGRLIGHYTLVGDEGRYVFLDPTDERVWKAVVAAFPGAIVSLQSWSQDHRKIAVRVDSPTEGPAFAIVDLATRRATWLGGEYNDLTPADIAEDRAIRFKAADGLELSGYLTLPRDRDPKKLPLIVFPHGGPAARDAPGFDWWAQGMASRGYAVLRVNFRGSVGFGEPLLTAGYGQWGRKMQTDLSDGVRHLAGQGVIDPTRVCIVGASYGGYAALAGAAIDRGVYRCAVSFGGVSDLDRFVTWSKARGGQSTFRYWTRFMGADEERSAKLNEISPATYAAQVSTPVLLIHGRDDSVVPLEQSQIMADALKKAGKPYELIVQKGEDHWLSRGETRAEMLTATMAFVEKHNPPN